MNKREIYKRAVDLLNELDLNMVIGNNAKYRDDYSGRGMYGDTTPAIVADSGVLVGWAVGQAIIEVEGALAYQPDFEDWVDEILPQRQDSMGRSQVFY